MDTLDTNWWGVWVVPLGVAICFGPALIAWAIAERRDHVAESRASRR